MECPGYDHLEHTADVLIEARGRTLEEAFEMAGIGMYEVITDTSRIKLERRVDLSVDGIDLENLLYRWLEEALLYTDTEGLVFGKFAVCKIEEVGDGYRITASAWGEPFDPERHEHRTIVKAMTYAQMSIRREGDCWRLTFVVDI